MKKALSLFLVLSMCLALLAVPALAEGTYTPGTYEASATGHEEGVKVTVTVERHLFRYGSELWPGQPDDL